MRYFLLALLLSCSSDVSIMKHPGDTDTSETIIVDTDDPQPASEPGDPPDTGSSMTDLTVGFAGIHFRQIACPACMGEPSEFDISAELMLHHPTSGDYTEHLTPIGTCSTIIYDSHVSMQPLASTSPASFNSIPLNPTGNGEWSNSYIYEYQYERNTSYSVSSEHGVITDAFQSVEGFDSIEPYTLLWVDPSYAFEATISKNGTYFSWQPVVANAQFEVLIAVYSPDGSQLLGMVSCMEQDTGSIFIPGNYFQSYPTWSLAAVHLSRHRTDRVAVPELNGWFESHMQWEVVGTGHVE